MKRIVKLLSIAVISLVLISIFAISNVSSYTVPSDLDDYTFEISEGEPVSQILTQLEQKKFIKSASFVSLYLKFNKELGTNIQAGTYRIEPGLTSIEVVKSLKGGVQLERLTFLEGWRREEYASYLNKKKGQDYALAFYEASSDLEGRLFPDTYFIDKNTSAKALVNMMTENFDKKAQEIAAPSPLPEKDVIVMASLIEREASDPTDMAIIAGILLKRLKNDWPLDVDASSQYALANKNANKIGGIKKAILSKDFDWWPKVLYDEQIHSESEYKTRGQLGLPPSPICNPGQQAIKAVLHPVVTEYWFYMTDKDGIMRYSTTLEEHNANIARFGVSE